MSGFRVQPGALEEFAGAAESAAGQVTALDPSTPLAGVSSAIPGTATAAAAADLAIRMTVSCQALADAVAELAGAARASDAAYGDTDGSAAGLLLGTGPTP